MPDLKARNLFFLRNKQSGMDRNHYQRERYGGVR